MAAEYDAKRFARLGESFFCKKGEALMKAGPLPEICYYVIRGCAISCEVDENGYTRCWGIHGQGSIILCEEMFYERPLSTDVVAVTDCELIRIARRDFLDAIKKDEALYLFVLEMLSRHCLEAVEELRRATTQTGDKRLCSLLISMAEPYAKDSDSEVMIGETFSQQTIATMLNANRITITRTMQKLRQAGMVLPCRNRHYKISSINRLRAYIEG